MPFRDRFDCLWCGTPHVTRTSSDLEGWAQLCPACLGKAGTNPFLRARLRDALAERGRANAHAGASAGTPPPATTMPATTPTAGARTAPRAGGGVATRVPAKAFPDDWFLRRGE
jgi:hypothetical protein